MTLDELVAELTELQAAGHGQLYVVRRASDLCDGPVNRVDIDDLPLVKPTVVLS